MPARSSGTLPEPGAFCPTVTIVGPAYNVEDTVGVAQARSVVIANTANLDDLTVDSEHWVNGCFADYYGFDSVVVIPSSP
jgi:hypothetical protein